MRKLLAVATIVIAGCSGGENIGSSAAATTITPTNTTLQYIATFPVGSPNAYQNDEPSCTWSPATRADGGRPVWVCGFNDGNQTVDGTRATTLMGWSWSNDGITWNRRDPAGGSPPMIAGMTAWHGDPQVVSDDVGNVAYITFGDSDANMSDAKFIVAALSINGGKTFTNTVQVNVDGGDCAPVANNEDQPSADFDITTPATTTAARKLSVAWRHNNGGVGDTPGACFRSGVFCATATSDPACSALPPGTVFPNVAWDTASGKSVGNLHRDNSLYGQSGIIVQAGDGAAAIVYADCDGSMVNCPNTNPQTCGWHRVLTYDSGADWSADATIDYTTTMQTCVVNGGAPPPPNGGKIEARHRATFAFVRDRRNGDYYVATAHAKGDLRLFRSQNQGATWTQIEDFTGGPTITFPVLASDFAGRLAVEFVQSDSTDSLVQPIFDANVFDPSASNPSPSPLPSDWVATPIVALYDPAANGEGVRSEGDYNSIAVANPVLDGSCNNTSTFMPAWTDPNSGVTNNAFNVHVEQIVVTR